MKSSNLPLSRHLLLAVALLSLSAAAEKAEKHLLTAYPEAQRSLDYEALDLGYFYPGALVRLDDGFARLADPFRRPLDGLRSLGNGVGTLADKLRVAALRRRALAGPWEGLFERPQQTSRAALEARG